MLKLKLRKINYISRKTVKQFPDKLFVFGDNFERQGLGGQAKEMRGEPNAVGIVTKVKPAMTHDAFLCDVMYDYWLEFSRKDFQRILSFEGEVIYPSNGIGSGYAQLRKHAPEINAAIEFFFKVIS